MMAFSSGSNNSLMSSTVLWKWVPLEHSPLMNAEFSMLLKDHLVHNLKATEGLLPNPQLVFDVMFLE